MKYVLKILAIVSALATLGIFILFIWMFVAWLGGGFNVLLPGLGLVITAPLILCALFIILLVMFSLTVLLFRMIFKPLR